MTSKKAARKWYNKIEDKQKVSQEFLRNAICFYQEPPERVVNFLNSLPADRCEKLEKTFANIREKAKAYIIKNKLSLKKEDEIFVRIVQGEIRMGEI